MLILSLDFGTSSLKAVLSDETGNVLKSTGRGYNYYTYDVDKAELKTETIEEALYGCLEDFREDLPRVDLICYCSFSVSCVFLDGEGRPVYPIITHLDKRAKEESRFVVDHFGTDRFLSITGILPFVNGASGTTLRWMFRHEPELMKRVRTFGHMQTWIYQLMTGVRAIDAVNASMTGLYETFNQSGWSKEITEVMGIDPAILPPVYESGSILGGVTKGFAVRTGLCEGTPVALGSNDGATASVGGDCFEPGDALNAAGSSDVLVILTDRPIANPNYYVRRSPLPGKYLLFATMVGGFALDWFHDQFCREMDKETYHAYVAACIAGGTDAGIVTFDPYLAGDRQSLGVKRAAFHNLNLDATRENMLAAVLRGIHAYMGTLMEEAEKCVHVSDTISITGGLANPSMIALKEQLFPGKHFVMKENCTHLGNIRLGLMGLERRRRQS